MKKAMFVVLCVALLTAVFSCGGGDDGPKTYTYTGTDKNRDEYTLKITEGDYDLLQNGVSVSTGKASKNGDVFTLEPNGLKANGDAGDIFLVTVSGKKITNIEGDITSDNGKTITPGEIVQAEPIAGNWEWSTSDDSTTNEWKGAKQSVFPPGGASRIDNAVDIADEKQPYEYPAGTVKDNDGNIIN